MLRFTERFIRGGKRDVTSHKDLPNYRRVYAETGTSVSRIRMIFHLSLRFNSLRSVHRPPVLKHRALILEQVNVMT